MGGISPKDYPVVNSRMDVRMVNYLISFIKYQLPYNIQVPCVKEFIILLRLTSQHSSNAYVTSGTKLKATILR